MLAIVNRNIARDALITQMRAFSVVTGSRKPKHRHGEYPPSERKIRRNQKKEERRKLAEHYKQLDEEANNSEFEKKWCCKLSL